MDEYRYYLTFDYSQKHPCYNVLPCSGGDIYFFLMKNMANESR